MARIMNDDLRTYMDERGIRKYHQDRSVSEFDVLVEACTTGRLDGFQSRARGLLVAGRDGYDAAHLLARWRVMDYGEDVLVTSACEVAAGTGDWLNGSRGSGQDYGEVLYEAELVVLTTFQDKGECPMTGEGRHRVQRFVMRCLNKSEHGILVQVHDEPLDWWSGGFRQVVANRFDRIVVGEISADG